MTNTLLKTLVESLVVECNTFFEKGDVDSSIALDFLSKPTMRVLRLLLGLVIPSFYLGSIYEQMLFSAHVPFGTLDHPLWRSNCAEIDWESLTTKGLHSLTDKEIALLALKPTAITMAYECVREEMQSHDAIAEEWFTHEELCRWIWKQSYLSNSQRDNTPTTRYSDFGFGLLNVEEADAEEAKYAFSIVASALGVVPKTIDQRAFEHGYASLTCSHCGVRGSLLQDWCPDCKYCPSENRDVADITNEIEMVDILVEDGATLRSDSYDRIMEKTSATAAAV